MANVNVKGKDLSTGQERVLTPSDSPTDSAGNPIAGIPLSQKGAANGVATLDGSGALTGAQVPSAIASGAANGTSAIDLFFGGSVNNGSTSYVNGNIYFNGEHLVSTNAYVHCDGPWNFSGNVSKASGSFLIDHPLDPANKYLLHSFVESPDMKNLYDGLAVADADGKAAVTLPPWFMALNDGFRYQLTCVGGYAPVFISKEIANNAFEIAGGTPGLKISWQVTGTRKDAYAMTNRIPIEVSKLPEDRGLYLHPEAFGYSAKDVVKKGYYQALDAMKKKS